MIAFREEEYYDREAVLGRDATSVFPQESLQQQAASKEAMVEALGARKFISESEVPMHAGWGNASCPYACPCSCCP